MAIVACFVCERSGCDYCKFTGVVENGEHLPPDQRPIDGAVMAEVKEEDTREMPVFRPGQEAA